MILIQRIQGLRIENLRLDNFRADLNSWSIPDQVELLQEYRQLIHTEPDALDRSRVAGHFTASALLVDPKAHKVMLLMHPKVGRWLQFGGHIEPDDESFAAAALRECQEESGYSDIHISTVPLAIDRHEVRCGGGLSTHWDVQFLATVDHVSARSTTENLQTEWFGFGADGCGAEGFGADVNGVTPELDLSVRRLMQAAWNTCYPQLEPQSMGTIHS